MTVLSMAILDLQRNSKFFKRYSEGTLTKPEYWEVAFDDSLDCLKVLPQIAGLIYTEKFGKAPVALKN